VAPVFELGDGKTDMQLTNRILKKEQGSLKTLNSRNEVAASRIVHCMSLLAHSEFAFYRIHIILFYTGVNCGLSP